MRILAVETSCDETACAITQNGTEVLSNVIYSQIAIHQKTGGVVPEVAAREHVDKILPVIEEALSQANLDWDAIDAIAVTQGPGLLSSLIVGTVTASTLALLKQKPLIPVHHIEGHLYAPFLGRQDTIEFPLMTLTVSGGHNEIVLMREHGEYEILGETLDDAAGEAFDKVARILGLPYPGGPEISKISINGDASKYEFPRALHEKKNLDFSFSGLKTAVLYKVEEEKKTNNALSEAFIADCAASFQEAVCDSLCTKFLHAASMYKVKSLQVTGGVSANNRLKEMMSARVKDLAATDPSLDIPLHFPSSLKFCTDNAAMISCAAYFKYQKNPECIADQVIPSCSFSLTN